VKAARLQIRTAEGIVFSQLLAGPVARLLAWVVDIAIILLILQLLSLVFSLIGLLSASVAMAMLALSYFAVSIGYGIICEWFWRGQTMGKRLLALRVVDADGLRLQFSQVAIRNLLRAVDALPFCYFVGGLACWFNHRGQRLGDFAANTIVVRNAPAVEPDIDQLLAGKFNSLRALPHLAARLRQQVSPAEGTVVLQAILRRDEFEPLARVRLFAELAAHFRAKAVFPPEVQEGMADEQYLRNVVDLVYRTASGKLG
jgi:uncharacterized RDD family membrane protein YckC